jgi:zinc protease
MRTALRRALLALAPLLPLLPLPAAAQPFDTPPPPTAPRLLQIDAPTESRLPNGLRVVVAERRGSPLVSAQLLVLSGAEADPPQLAGLATLTAGLLTRGTRRQDAPAQAAAAEALGGTLDSQAGWHQAGVGITVTTPRLGAALALVAEAALHPAFRATELARLRDETLDELKVAYARPGTLASLAANRMLFGDGAYGHPATGTPASLARITRADVQRAHRERYRPDNAVLVLAGDIGTDEALALARRHFGAWKAPATALPADRPAAGTPSAQALTLVDMGDSGQAAVSLALRMPAAGAPDEIAGEVANAVLGGGYSSRLNLEIRIKRGLSYGAGSAFDLRRLAGVLRATVQTKNASAAEVLALVQAQVDGLAAAPVPADELAARKAALIGGFGRSVETTAGLAGQLAALVVHGRPVASLKTRIAALQAVDAAAVQAYAQARFANAPRSAAVAGDARAFAAALQAAAPAGAPAPLEVKAAALDLGP